MIEKEDAKLKAYLERENSFLGRAANIAIDTARGAVGKPGLWLEARRYEIREEAKAQRATTVAAPERQVLVMRAEQVAERLAAAMSQNNELLMELDTQQRGLGR